MRKPVKVYDINGNECIAYRDTPEWRQTVSRVMDIIGFLVLGWWALLLVMFIISR